MPPILPPDYEFPSPDLDMPTLPFWQARSFYLTLLALVGSVLPVAGIDWPWVSDPATVDAIMQIVSGVAAVLAFRERIAPKRRLTMGGK